MILYACSGQKKSPERGICLPYAAEGHEVHVPDA